MSSFKVNKFHEARAEEDMPLVIRDNKNIETSSEYDQAADDENYLTLSVVTTFPKQVEAQHVSLRSE